MAVVITNFNAMQQSAVSAASLSFVFDCTGGNYLITGFQDQSGEDNITSVTYNGVAMTLLKKQARSQAGLMIYMYGLLNPTVGSNNLVISRSVLTNRIQGSAVAVSGARTTQPANTFGGHNGTAPTTSGTIMTTTLDEGVFGVQLNDNGGDSAGANTTIISQTAFGDFQLTRSTVFPTTTAQNVTLTVSSGASGNTATVIVGIASTIPATSSTNFFQMF